MPLARPEPPRALRQALENGELEHDLALEVADRNLDELDDAGLVLAVGSLIASARDQAAGAVERCLELAELATARAFERFAPDALAATNSLALEPDPWRDIQEGDT
jgi:hypothetical protein